MFKFTVLIVILLFFSLISYAEISWNFDNNVEGWQIVDLTTNGPYTAPLAYYPLNYMTTGGMTGGFIRGHDPTSNTYAFCMPDSSVENMDSFLNENISFYLRSTHNDWTSEPFLILVCNSDVLISEITLPTTEWQFYSIDFVLQNFYLYGGGTLTQSYFETLLQNVEHLYIIAEYGDGVVENTDLDTVIISDIGCDSLQTPELFIDGIDPVAEEITLIWNPIPSASSYKVFELSSPYNSPVVEHTVLADTTITLPISTDKRFYYVKALCGE